MRGIDISNWQGSVDIGALRGVDFVIAKATEGTSFVDKYCDGTIQQCIKLGIPWGFYHFAANGTAKAEADHFIAACEGYIGKGVPVLDWEGNQSVAWVNDFVARFYEKTKVRPWIYANPWRFNQGGVDKNCARWIASYPSHLLKPSIDADPGKMPKTDGLVAAWQFASDGQVKGFKGDIDVNIGYIDKAAWMKYAVGDRPEAGESASGSAEGVAKTNGTKVFKSDRLEIWLHERISEGSWPTKKAEVGQVVKLKDGRRAIYLFASDTVRVKAFLSD